MAHKEDESRQSSCFGSKTAALIQQLIRDILRALHIGGNPECSLSSICQRVLTDEPDLQPTATLCKLIH